MILALEFKYISQIGDQKYAYKVVVWVELNLKSQSQSQCTKTWVADKCHERILESFRHTGLKMFLYVYGFLKKHFSRKIIVLWSTAKQQCQLGLGWDSVHHASQKFSAWHGRSASTDTNCYYSAWVLIKIRDTCVRSIQFSGGSHGQVAVRTAELKRRKWRHVRGLNIFLGKAYPRQASTRTRCWRRHRVPHLQHNEKVGRQIQSRTEEPRRRPSPRQPHRSDRARKRTVRTMK